MRRSFKKAFAIIVCLCLVMDMFVQPAQVSYASPAGQPGITAIEIVVDKAGSTTVWGHDFNLLKNGTSTASNVTAEICDTSNNVIASAPSTSISIDTGVTPQRMSIMWDRAVNAGSYILKVWQAGAAVDVISGGAFEVVPALNYTTQTVTGGAIEVTLETYSDMAQFQWNVSGAAIQIKVFDNDTVNNAVYTFNPGDPNYSTGNNTLEFIIPGQLQEGNYIEVIENPGTAGERIIGVARIAAANMILNGSFDANTASWTFKGSNGGSGSLVNEGGWLKAVITAGGTSTAHALIEQDFNGPIYPNVAYTLSFDCKAEVNSRRVDIKLAENGGSYAQIWNKDWVSFNTTPRHYTYAFKSSLTYTINKVRFQFKAGLSDQDIWVDNVVLTRAFTIPPASLTAVTVTNVSSTAGGTYHAGDIIPIQVTFDQNVEVTGNPGLKLETGEVDRYAVYDSGSGTNTLTFLYTVTPGDESMDLDYASSFALELNDGTIKNGSTDANLALPLPGTTGSLGANADIIVENIQPAVTVIDVTSDVSGTFNNPLAVVPIKVVFSDTVIVTGSPKLKLETGTTDRYAVYEGGSGTDTLTFKYTLGQGDTSPDLDYASTSALEASGTAAITDEWGLSAVLVLPAPGAAHSLSANADIVISIPTGGGWNTQLISKNANDEWQFNTVNVGGKTWNIGEYDFSYAGYKYMDKPYGDGVPNNVRTISAAEGEDITAKINEAVNALGQAGGGIVEIPAGSYKIGTNEAVVQISYDNVILRGAGTDATKLTVDSTFKSADDYSIGAIRFGYTFEWKDANPVTHPQLQITTVTSDIAKGSHTITVADASNYNVGDYINIRQQQWEAFNTEFFGGNTSLLTNNSFAFHYLRRVTGKSGNTLTVDIPFDLDLSPDNKQIALFKVDAFFVKNVGIEDIQIDVMANGEITYNADETKITKNTNSGTAVVFVSVWNGWAKNVKITNMNRLGFATAYATALTFDNCVVDTARNRGEGGNGYGYYIKGQNLLYINSEAKAVRHGFTTASPVTSNVVVKDCKSTNLVFDKGLAGEAVDDTHIAFAHGLLFDNHYMDASGLYMHYRGTLSTNAYQTIGWAVLWNVFNTANNPYNLHQDAIKLTPGLYGYVIGAHGGPGLKVYDGAQRSPDVIGQVETDPSLHVGTFANKVLYEGIGLSGLNPRSLYEVMYGMRSHDTALPDGNQQPPMASVTAATVLSGENVTTAKSSKLGSVYLLPSGTYTNKADLDAAVNEMTGTIATVVTPFANTTIKAPAVPGNYYLYAVDLDGNVSAESGTFITVIRKFDVTITFNVGASKNADKLAAGKRLQTEARITNNSRTGTKNSDLKNVMIVLALYDQDGSLVKVAYKPVTMGYDAVKGQLCTVIDSVGFTLPENINGYTAKAFVWDSIPSWAGAYWNGTGIPETNMNPYTDVFIIAE